EKFPRPKPAIAGTIQIRIPRNDRHLSHGHGILSPDCKLVVSVESSSTMPCLRLWEVATGRLVREFGDHYCISACFSADGKMLATLGTSQPNDNRYRGL